MPSNTLGWVPILAVVALQLLLIRSVSSQNVTNEYLIHQCNNTQGTYTAGSTFEKNLKQVIRSISNLELTYGYTYLSSEEGYKVSKDPNIVFVLLQCRGDTLGPKCHSCLATALSGLRERCPGNRGATIWYDQCLLQISSVDSELRIHYKSFFYMSNPKNVSTSDPKLFEDKRRDLLHKLMLEAAKLKKDNDGKGSLYAVGEMRIGKDKMYAMVQCTQDIWPNACHVCQEWIAGKYGEFFYRKAGGRVVGRSCSLRFELYPFLRR